MTTLFLSDGFPKRLTLGVRFGGLCGTAYAVPFPVNT